MNFLIQETIFILFIFIYSTSIGQSSLPQQIDRWSIQNDSSIVWRIKDRLPHSDHIEMSGEKVSVWINYSIDSAKTLSLKKTIVFPSFRIRPNDTHASMMYSFCDTDYPRILIDKSPLHPDIIDGRLRKSIMQTTDSITHKGIMRIYSTLGKDGSVYLEHSIFPSVEKPLVIEKLIFKNVSKHNIIISIDYLKKDIRTDSLNSIRGPHQVIMESLNSGHYTLKPGDNLPFAIYYQALNKYYPPANIIVDQEEKARIRRIQGILNLMMLETPETILNTAFSFAKIRTVESIYKTRGGYMHSPGGLAYYAAIWANDQAEYVNPLFAMLGDTIANKSAMNAFRKFAGYMNPEFEPIPSSIIAEGEGYWNGKGDRGDMAMIAYGATRYALAYGSLDSAKVLWPLITWCLEYCRKHLNEDGVVMSDTDELEDRFPSGDANLSTSSLYYDALRSAVFMGRQLDVSHVLLKDYENRAKSIRKNIEKYFGSDVQGFHTYKYYKENEVLRSWICLPLCMGIYDRKMGTIDALFSSRLWTVDGLATEAGDKTFWDRSTLYALRGVLQGGEVDKAIRYIRDYSRRRLLGEHVPYPVEAYPEGNQRHLAAESGLYCRIFTEGMFGIRPIGLKSFECTPRLPKEWDHMALRNIHSFGSIFDLEIVREDPGKLLIRIIQGNRIREFGISDGETITLTL